MAFSWCTVLLLNQALSACTHRQEKTLIDPAGITRGLTLVTWAFLSSLPLIVWQFNLCFEFIADWIACFPIQLCWLSHFLTCWEWYIQKFCWGSSFPFWSPAHVLVWFSQHPSLFCVSSMGGWAMWEMKRGLCFPAERKSWIWISLGSGELLHSPNHLSFKGMFMFAHFSPSIVPEESELMRMLLSKSFHILRSSCNVGREAQSQHPTFLMPIFRSESGTEGTAQTSSSLSPWSRKDCGKTLSLFVSHNDIAMNNHDRIHGNFPAWFRVKERLMREKQTLETFRVKSQKLTMHPFKRRHCERCLFLRILKASVLVSLRCIALWDRSPRHLFSILISFPLFFIGNRLSFFTRVF